MVSPQASLGVKKPSRALLYVILSPVGSYFSTGVKPVSLWADPKYIRAWRGGTGDCKMGGYTHTRTGPSHRQTCADSESHAKKRL